MKKLVSILFVMMMIFSLMVPVFATAEGTGNVMWVNCADGKRLNVREAPQKGAKILCRADCGTKIEILNTSGLNGWAYVYVEGKNTRGYVMTKFLVGSKPGKYEITERDDNFRTVSPYMVTAKARGKNTDSSVGLRVSPNKTASMIRRLTAGEKLQVVAKAKTWSKVVDPATGRTGYVANDYIARV